MVVALVLGMDDNSCPLPRGSIGLAVVSELPRFSRGPVPHNPGRPITAGPRVLGLEGCPASVDAWRPANGGGLHRGQKQGRAGSSSPEVTRGIRCGITSHSCMYKQGAAEMIGGQRR